MQLEVPERVLQAQETLLRLGDCFKARSMLNPIPLQLAGLSHFNRKVQIL